MDAKTLFETTLPHAISTSPDKAKTVNAIFLFKIKGDRGGIWTVDLKATPPLVVSKDNGNAECTIECEDSDFETMIDDPKIGMQLFFQGKIKILGDPMLATKLQQILSL